MLMERFRVSQRIACRVVVQPRATQRYEAVPRAGESALTHAILELANLYGRYGYSLLPACCSNKVEPYNMVDSGASGKLKD